MKKTLLCAILTLLLLLSPFGAVCASAEETGATFSSTGTYYSAETLDRLPSTYEAVLCMPADLHPSEWGGVILGNYCKITRMHVSFEIASNGHPRLQMMDDLGTLYRFTFEDVNLLTGEWVHLAIVKDSEAKTVTCYINGEAVQTIEAESPTDISLSSGMCIGSDPLMGNPRRFRGTLRSVTLFSDVRTADEIRADAAAEQPAGDHLMAHYRLTGKPEVLTPSSGTGPEFRFRRLTSWLEDFNGTSAQKNYAYSFAVLGDIQIMTESYPEKLSQMIDWIADNVNEKKIKHVFGLGDITNRNTVGEWKRAKAEFEKLDSLVEYSLVRGNHDNSGSFSNYFKYEEFLEKGMVTGAYNESMTNSYHKFTVGNHKYLALGLDVGASDAALAWANEVVESNPDYNVIVFTHIYLHSDGTTLDAKDPLPATKYGGTNTGDKIWDKLIRKHKNIVLVLSGHVAIDRIIMRQDEGDHGNKIPQLLIDPQGVDKDLEGVGLVSMLYFSPDGKDVSVEYYSTDRQAHFYPENQFHLTLDTVPVEQDFTWIVFLVAGVGLVALALVFFLSRKKKKTVSNEQDA